MMQKLVQMVIPSAILLGVTILAELLSFVLPGVPSREGATVSKLFSLNCISFELRRPASLENI